MWHSHINVVDSNYLNYPLIVTLFKHIANDVFIFCFSFLPHADVLLAIPME